MSLFSFISRRVVVLNDNRLKFKIAQCMNSDIFIPKGLFANDVDPSNGMPHASLKSQYIAK